MFVGNGAALSIEKYDIVITTAIPPISMIAMSNSGASAEMPSIRNKYMDVPIDGRGVLFDCCCCSPS